MNVSNSKQIPAEFGIWLFILIDLCIFAMYFWVFAWDKSHHPNQFIQGQESLNGFFGAFNTVVLLTSSYFMASAVHAARALRFEIFQGFLKLTIFCGLVFLLIKTLEYIENFDQGMHITTNEFYRNYFTFTGFHLLHVIFGLGFLIYLLVSIKSKKHAEENILRIEGVGLYWHMVDLLWLVLFTLIYWLP